MISTSVNINVGSITKKAFIQEKHGNDAYSISFIDDEKTQWITLEFGTKEQWDLAVKAMDIKTIKDLRTL